MVEKKKKKRLDRTEFQFVPWMLVIFGFSFHNCYIYLVYYTTTAKQQKQTFFSPLNILFTLANWKVSYIWATVIQPESRPLLGSE